jgi:hypothetical protein
LWVQILDIIDIFGKSLKIVPIVPDFVDDFVTNYWGHSPSRKIHHPGMPSEIKHQKVEFYYPQERLRQPTAAVCRRCDNDFINTISRWNGEGGSSYDNPPQRSPRMTGFRETSRNIRRWN